MTTDIRGEVTYLFVVVVVIVVVFSDCQKNIQPEHSFGKHWTQQQQKREVTSPLI